MSGGTLRHLERILQDLGELPAEIIRIIATKVREMVPPPPRPPSLNLRGMLWYGGIVHRGGWYHWDSFVFGGTPPEYTRRLLF